MRALRKFRGNVRVIIAARGQRLLLREQQLPSSHREDNKAGNKTVMKPKRYGIWVPLLLAATVVSFLVNFKSFVTVSNSSPLPGEGSDAPAYEGNSGSRRATHDLHGAEEDGKGHNSTSNHTIRPAATSASLRSPR